MSKGRAFPIRRQDVKGYTALTPNGSSARRLVSRPIAYRPNAGVTHIAAVNGRGSYARAHQPSAREAAGLRRNAGSIRLSGSSHEGEVPMIRLRKNRATAVTPNKKRKKARAKKRVKRNGGYSLAAIHDARKALKKKSKSSRRRARAAGSARYKKIKAARKATKARKAKRRAPKLTANRKRVRRSPRKRKLTSNRRRVRRVRKNPLTTNRKRRPAKRRTKMRRNSRRRVSSRRRTRRVRRSHAVTPNRRRRSMRRNSRRRVRRNRSHRATPNRRRRSMRRNRAATPNRRRRSMRRNGRRRSMRRNGSALMSFFKEAAVTGLLVAGGFFAHKLLTNLVEENFMRGLFDKKEEKPAATAGYGNDAKKTELKDYSKLISGALVAVAGVGLTGYLVKDKAMALKLSAGMVTSFIQQAVLTYLVESQNAQGIQYLSGLDDGSAARLSAMAGDVSRTTIQPFYTRLGEYFPHGTSGYGEYFSNPAMGEYFANPAMSGFGALEAAAGLGGGIYAASAGYGADALTPEQRKFADDMYVLSGRTLYGSHQNLYKPVAGFQGYGSNPDIYQAVAGSHHRYIEGQHIDPSTANLDRELSMMESMSGVGQVSSWNTELAPMQDGEGSAFRDGSLGRVYAASAGMGEFIEPGAGGVQTVPSTQTWIPGESEGELWAGVRQIDAGMATADVPAGIMQTIGGSGIFG